MEELLLMALKKIDELEKKVERYYQLLKYENELDLILKGTYITSKDVGSIMNGTYI